MPYTTSDMARLRIQAKTAAVIAGKQNADEIDVIYCIATEQYRECSLLCKELRIYDYFRSSYDKTTQCGNARSMNQLEVDASIVFCPSTSNLVLAVRHVFLAGIVCESLVRNMSLFGIDIEVKMFEAFGLLGYSPQEFYACRKLAGWLT